MICPKKMEGIFADDFVPTDGMSKYLETYCQCEEERCAWWIEVKKCCAIKDLATSLDMIIRKP